MPVSKNILIGVTGSIKIVRTLASKEYFFDSESCDLFEVFDDTERVKYKKSDPILHIELRRWADIYLICPLDANTLAKISIGLCDNLLTDIARAWDMSKPFWVYPSMNTYMYEHKLTEEQLNKLKSFGIKVIPPITKKLACGDYGMGALPEPDQIVESVYNHIYC
ncbi:phosphopantothenoylcysteine decarboxylase [Theileria orientalis]|uniref:Phosphopantothenoylcysteine decarboxylase n=1 Tax=Theileria orientalis TaxID=68886 RepID=A0A976SJH0_THEOR|nr:phosphopantothenoylcysteine decarboxylase [Theileria orientalis]